MNALENIESLVESLTERVETLLDERGRLLAETARLRLGLAERDEEAVRASQQMQVALELARADALRFEQECIRIEEKLEELNDRLIRLVQSERPRREAAERNGE